MADVNKCRMTDDLRRGTVSISPTAIQPKCRFDKTVRTVRRDLFKFRVVGEK
jgi:hypothetical protein